MFGVRSRKKMKTSFLMKPLLVEVVEGAAVGAVLPQLRVTIEERAAAAS